MRLLLLITAMLLTNTGYARSGGLYLDDSYIEGRKHWHLIDPFFDELGHQTSEYWVWGIALGLDLTLLEHNRHALRFHNRVEGDSSNERFRRVSWDYDLFYSYRDRIELGWDHQSQHLLDLGSENFYPLHDSFYLRLRFK